MYTVLHVQCRLLLSGFNETWIFGQFFEKQTNIKFHQNPSSGSRVVPCGRTDMTKPIVAFRNFVNAPKKSKTVPLQAKQPQRVGTGAVLHTLNPQSGERWVSATRPGRLTSMEPDRAPTKQANNHIYSKAVPLWPKANLLPGPLRPSLEKELSATNSTSVQPLLKVSITAVRNGDLSNAEMFRVFAAFDKWIETRAGLGDSERFGDDLRRGPTNSRIPGLTNRWGTLFISHDTTRLISLHCVHSSPYISRGTFHQFKKKTGHVRTWPLNMRNWTYRFISSSAVKGLDRPRGFQEVKVPRFRDKGRGRW